MLHSYQNEAVNNVIESFNTCKSVLLQMPTGTGKTHVFCDIIKKTNKRTLVLVHTRELVFQIKQRLKLFGINAGVIVSGEIAQPNLMVQIASIQTLNRREMSQWPKNVQLIVIDEAHHATAKSYQLIIEAYNQPTVKVLGVTATPYRMNNTGFQNTFEKLIESQSIREFIEQGYLAGFKHMATACPELKHISIDRITNDYNINELAEAMSGETIMSDLVDSYQKHANNKKCILFAVNRCHSKLIVERFKNAGISADYIDSKTKLIERQSILEKFKKGEIKVLCNVQIFTEGFDCPDISVVQLARPTKSLVLYMQMIGRVLRKKPDGSTALILDNAGLWKRHGLVTKKRKWRLQGVIETTNTVATKTKTGLVEEVEPDKVIEVDGLEMQELATVEAPIKKEEIRENDNTLTVHFIKNNNILKTLNFSINFQMSMGKLKQYLAVLKQDEQPDELILIFKGVEIPNQWQKKQLWLQKTEKYLQESMPENFIQIGCEEQKNALMLRLINSQCSLSSLSKANWDSLVNC